MEMAILRPFHMRSSWRLHSEAAEGILIESVADNNAASCAGFVSLFGFSGQRSYDAPSRIIINQSITPSGAVFAPKRPPVRPVRLASGNHSFLIHE